MRKSIRTLYSLLLISILMGCGSDAEQTLEPTLTSPTQNQPSKQTDTKVEQNEEIEDSTPSITKKEHEKELEEQSVLKDNFSNTEIMVHFIDVGQGAGALVIDQMERFFYLTGDNYMEMLVMKSLHT